MVTFNQINRAFNNIAVAHKQINTYGIGDIWEIATSGDIRYPMMWAKPENGRLETNIYVSSWTLIFMDIVDNGERNENDVISDMELVALDVVALLRDPDYEFDFDYQGATIERFTEKFEDKVAGVLLKIDIRIPYTADRCQVPQSGLTITGSAGSTGSANCAAATAILINSSGTIISSNSISSGSSSNITAPDGTVIVNTQDGTQLGSKNVASNGNGVITLTDSAMYDTMPIAYNYPMPTGQTTSYATGDDAYYWTNLWQPLFASTIVGMRPQLASFTTLISNNSFGNTNRFTDSVGGQTYSNNYLIDHYTGLGWYILVQSAANWANSIAAAEAFSTLFSDWFVPNQNQQASIANFSLSDPLNFAPFNLASTSIKPLWASTTSPAKTTFANCFFYAYTVASDEFSGGRWGRGKTDATVEYLLCRKHF